MNRLRVILAALILAAGITAALGTPSHASGYSEWCSSQPYCANDYGNGGAGTAVVSNPEHASNNNFAAFRLSGYCGNGGYVTSTCPFTDHAIDQRLQGNVIIALGYQQQYSLCIGTNYAAQLDMGPCPPNNGQGGGSNIWVLTLCSGSYQWESVYWDNQYFDYNEPYMPNTNSTQMGMAVGSGPLNGTCLQYLSS